MTAPWFNNDNSESSSGYQDTAGEDTYQGNEEGTSSVDDLIDEVSSEEGDNPLDTTEYDADSDDEGTAAEEDASDEDDLQESTLSVAKSDADRLDWNDVTNVYNFAVAFQKMGPEKQDRFTSYLKPSRKAKDDPIALARDLAGIDSKVPEVRAILGFAEEVRGGGIMAGLNIAKQFDDKSDEERDEIVKIIASIARDYGFKAPVNRKSDTVQEKAMRVVESLSEISDDAVNELEEFLELINVWPGDK